VRNGEIVTSSVEETSALAAEIAAEVRDGGVLCLYGDLGSGKTTFTQGLAKALDISKHVTSPTFLIMRTYELALSKEHRAKGLFHIDLYRLNSEAEMEDIGLSEILSDPENIVVIEWSEKLGKKMPEKRIDIRFEYVDDERRKIEIQNNKLQASNNK
jgi:tRNA threonylcarbamoyladenosine biosynthesis protein TsaE